MDATNWLGKMTLTDLLGKLSDRFPEVKFEVADVCRWDSAKNVVFYTPKHEYAVWSLLHETGHMLSNHQSYTSDLALLQMEVEAWSAAKSLAGEYEIGIDENYIEDCIDSYRDWVHKRSTCPVCAQTGVEQKPGQYKCINCSHTWQVSHERFCRVYRKSKSPA